MSCMCQCWFLCCLFMNTHKQTNDCIYTDRSVARKAALISRQLRERQGRVEQKSEQHRSLELLSQELPWGAATEVLTLPVSV